MGFTAFFLINGVIMIINGFAIKKQLAETPPTEDSSQQDEGQVK